MIWWLEQNFADGLCKLFLFKILGKEITNTSDTFPGLCYLREKITMLAHITMVKQILLDRTLLHGSPQMYWPVSCWTRPSSYKTMNKYLVIVNVSPSIFNRMWCHCVAQMLTSQEWLYASDVYVNVRLF